MQTPPDPTAYFYLSDGRFTVKTDDNKFSAHFADKTMLFVELYSELIYLLEMLGYECRVIDSSLEG